MNPNSKLYYSLVREVNGELVLDLHEELLRSLGWGEGTVVEWSVDEKTQTIRIQKVASDYTEL